MNSGFASRFVSFVPTTAGFIFLTLGSPSAHAQGLSPSAPTKELIYFGGLLVAVEERGPAPKGNAVSQTSAMTSEKASAKTAAASSTPPAPTQPYTPPPPIPAPALAVPGVPPKDTSSGAAQLAPPPSSTQLFVPYTPR